LKRSAASGVPARKIRALLSSTMLTLKAAGAEFLDSRGAGHCRVGLPRWRESEERRRRRARQEMKVFRLLDDAGTVVLRRGELPELDAWEARLEKEGYECSSHHRVGDRGCVHVITRKKRRPSPDDDEVMLELAEAIERILDP